MVSCFPCPISFPPITGGKEMGQGKDNELGLRELIKNGNYT